MGSAPFNIFINRNNVIFVTAYSIHQLLVLPSVNETSTRNIATGLWNPCGLFVTVNNDIYVDNGQNYSRVERWAMNNASNGVAVKNVPSYCANLFVDTNGILYCSNDWMCVVLKSSLTTGMSTSFVAIAGNGTLGSSSTLLHYPNGIFVDVKRNLYVADCGNNRVQLFALNQLNGTTIAGYGSSGTIDLHCPMGIILDGDDFMFIVDHGSSRIVASGPAGFRCIVGCSGTIGSGPDQLRNPRFMAFDSDGNLFVSDTDNGRVQKFQLATNTCSKSGHRHSQSDRDRQDILHHVAEGVLCAARMKLRVFVLTSPTLHTLNSPSTSPASRLSS